MEWAIKFTGKYHYYYLLLPAGLILSTLLTRYFAPEAEGHGTEKVIEAVHKKSGKIDFAVIPVKILATIVTIASGGSAGKEGPSAQIGAGVASLFSTIFKFSDSKTYCKIWVELFGAPIAPYAAIACVISYFMTGHRSVYPSQIFEIKKSQFVEFETGKEIGEIRNKIVMSSKHIEIIKNFKDKFRKK